MHISYYQTRVSGFVHFIRGAGLLFLLLMASVSSGQERSIIPGDLRSYHEMRKYDSVMAVKIPVLHLPEGYLNKSLPVAVDNSVHHFFPGIYDQMYFFTCQQYSGISYTYTYERNRILGADGSLPENRFPAHYSWNFMNHADRFTGVSFFYSFQLLKEQGYMSQDDYGPDTAQSISGWISGYDKYYRAMKNRINAVYAIPVNTEEGVLTLKHYLNDHLDGSATGGIACFSASSNFQNTNVKEFPAGTPEAGKNVIISFYPIATHGMTIIGFNDSVRYDINGDGRFTNDVDINSDGIIDVKDWEIGAWRMANSYGTSWHDNGYSYILYRATALDYDYAGGNWVADRGIWNSAVYVVQPVAGYSPLLTMKLTLTYNARNRISVKAGVSHDTTSRFPEHTIDFPLFSGQGGDHYMQGFEDSDERKTIEAGFDVTPLLSYIRSGKPARFFLLIEERDSLHNGEGFVNHCSFIDYAGGGTEIPCMQENVPVNDNTVTFLSATGTVLCQGPAITTSHLPAYQPGIPYQYRLEAAGGKAPLTWSLVKEYEQGESDSAYATENQQPVAQQATYIPYKIQPLPFSFPFYGKDYDTVYVNFYGFVSFDSDQIPYPYITDEESMMRRNAIIAPAFTMNAYYHYPDNGVWVESLPERVTIRWEYGDSYLPSFVIRTELRLYPSGKFEIIYGTPEGIPEGYPAFTGYSAGDELNYSIFRNFDLTGLGNRGFLHTAKAEPAGLTLDKEGLLSVISADSSKIFDIRIMVTDANHISSDRWFSFSDGPGIDLRIHCGADSLLKFDTPANLSLTVRNGSTESLAGCTMRLSANDASIEINDSISTLPLLEPGDIVDIPDAFSFKLASPLKDQSEVGMLLTISSGNRNWTKAFSLHISSPVISIPSLGISDGQDGLLNPGEIANLRVNITNQGSLYADNLSALLVSEDSLVSVISGPEIIIERIESHSQIYIDFMVSASRTALSGHKASLGLSLTDGKSVNIEIPVSLSLGKVPVAIVNFTSDLSSRNAMTTALDSLGVAYTVYEDVLPGHIQDYEGIFITSGTSTGGHMLSLEESEKVAEYLEQGGNLYLEISPSWFYFYFTKTSLNPMLKYTPVKGSLYYYHSLSGVPGTLSEGIYFEYLHSMNHSTFSILPQSPAEVIFNETDSLTYNFQVASSTSTCRTIASMVEYGWLSGGQEPSTHKTLMRRYLDFFRIDPPGPKAYFHSDKNVVCRWDTVHFTDDSFEHVTSRSWEFPGGTPSSSTEKNPVVTYIDPGKYTVTLTVSDGENHKQISRENYIVVETCLGVSQQVALPEFSVYPNPASRSLNVTFMPGKGNEVLLNLTDLAGRNVKTQRVGAGLATGNYVLDVSSLKSGMYILRVVSGDRARAVKVMIE